MDSLRSRDLSHVPFQGSPYADTEPPSRQARSVTTSTTTTETKTVVRRDMPPGPKKQGRSYSALHLHDTSVQSLPIDRRSAAYRSLPAHKASPNRSRDYTDRGGSSPDYMVMNGQYSPTNRRSSPERDEYYGDLAFRRSRSLGMIPSERPLQRSASAPGHPPEQGSYQDQPDGIYHAQPRNITTGPDRPASVGPERQPYPEPRDSLHSSRASLQISYPGAAQSGVANSQRVIIPGSPSTSQRSGFSGSASLTRDPQNPSRDSTLTRDANQYILQDPYYNYNQPQKHNAEDDGNLFAGRDGRYNQNSLPRKPMSEVHPQRHLETFQNAPSNSSYGNDPDYSGDSSSLPQWRSFSSEHTTRQTEHEMV